MILKKVKIVFLYCLVYGVFGYTLQLLVMIVLENSIEIGYRKSPIHNILLWFVFGFIYLLVSQAIFKDKGPDGKIL